jgi:hypothetical protein
MESFGGGRWPMDEELETELTSGSSRSTIPTQLMGLSIGASVVRSISQWNAETFTGSAWGSADAGGKVKMAGT